MSRAGGSVYFVIRKSHRWMWRPMFRRDPQMYYFAMWWLGIFIGVPRPEKDWK